MMPYILHAGLILAACLVFYKILLQQETFFRLNRWILIVCLVLSFGLPLIKVPQQWSFTRAETPVAAPVATIDNDQPASAPAVTTPVTENKPPTESKNFNWSAVLTWAFRLYWLGVIIFAINFLLQIVTLLYRAYRNPVIKDGPFRIVELSGDTAPCSFGNNIFINPAKYDWETYTQVLEHEKIHVQEKHTLDLVFAELVIIFQWFNPFAWWYRKALENNLEFLTDARLLHHPQVEKATYQLSLLKVSAPHFPLSLTTNYNQSLLKKRVAMMNAKKSNVHTAWKYLFLFPVLVLSVCLLNETSVKAQSDVSVKKLDKVKYGDGIPTEGYWFATIKDDQVRMQFKSDEDDESHNNTNFAMSDFKNLPREGAGNFSVSREAGTIEFTSKFENNQGMGRYKFVADKSYADAMRKEGIEFDNDREQMVYFMVDVRKDYVQMLKKNGYKDFDKDQLIPLAALKIDEAFINTFKKNGYENVSLQQLIPLKAVGVTLEYIDEIKKAGYPNVSLDQLVTFKAQNITGKYISDVRSSDEKRKNSNNNNRNNNNINDNNNNHSGGTSADNIVALKALDINPEYINSLKEVGYDNLSNDQLIPLKAQGITAEYIRKLKAEGFEDLSANDLIAIKAQDITMEYLKSFESAGYTRPSVQRALGLKAMNVTVEFIKSFNDVGYKNISLEEAVSMKAQNITPSVVKEYNDLGFGTVPMHDIIAARATGTTPSFIKNMKEKGHNFKSLQKYVTLKTVVED
jgi:hypothetical protein